MNFFKRHFGAIVSAFLLAMGSMTYLANATTIEGFTPSGNFQTVGVSDAGALFVNILSTTPQHVITDTGSYITGIVNPVQVYGVAGAPVAVTFSTNSASFTVNAASATTPAVLRTNHATSQFALLSTNAARKQSIICNTDTGIILYYGPTGVTTATGAFLPPLACLSPDVPASFTGALFGISSAASTGNLISVTTFQ